MGSDINPIKVGERSSSYQPCLQKVDFPRPYICLFTSLCLVICPSVCPFDYGWVMAAHTAALSLAMPHANDAISPVLASAIHESKSSTRFLRSIT